MDPSRTGHTVSHHGAPGSEQRAALRTTQAAIAAQPTHRRRRSLLLLALEHQVRFEELPWIAAIRDTASPVDAADGARQTLEQVTTTARRAFPHAVLPDPELWDRRPNRATRRWGKVTADDFATVCRNRSREAHASTGAGGGVAANGAILEQSQILTTHNVAVLIDALGLRQDIAQIAPDLADPALSWVVQRHTDRVADRRAALRMVKNTAYAWRQALIFLSLCDPGARVTALRRLRDMVAATDTGVRSRLTPALAGLEHVAAGGRFDASGHAPNGGRRFLGWSVGPHWMLTAGDRRARLAFKQA